MPLFRYIARRPNAERLHGTVHAVSLQAARDILREMHLDAEELYEAPPTLEHDQHWPWSSGSGHHDAEESSRDQSAASPKRNPVPVYEPAPEGTVGGLSDAAVAEGTRSYFPIKDTLRLYCGWLLAWYFLIFAFGSYAYLRALPVKIPLVSSLFQSPVLISFAFGAYLFLLLTDLQRVLRGTMGLGILLTLGWFGLFVVFRMNM